MPGRGSPRRGRACDRCRICSRRWPPALCSYTLEPMEEWNPDLARRRGRGLVGRRLSRGGLLRRHASPASPVTRPTSMSGLVAAFRDALLPGWLRCYRSRGGCETARVVNAVESRPPRGTCTGRCCPVLSILAGRSTDYWLSLNRALTAPESRPLHRALLLRAHRRNHMSTSAISRKVRPSPPRHSRVRRSGMRATPGRLCWALTCDDRDRCPGADYRSLPLFDRRLTVTQADPALLTDLRAAAADQPCRRAWRPRPFSRRHFGGGCKSPGTVAIRLAGHPGLAQARSALIRCCSTPGDGTISLAEVGSLARGSERARRGLQAISGNRGV